MNAMGQSACMMGNGQSMFRVTLIRGRVPTRNVICKLHVKAAAGPAVHQAHFVLVEIGTHWEWATGSEEFPIRVTRLHKYRARYRAVPP